MFNFLKRKPPICPVNDEMSIWIEDAFSWFDIEFGVDFIKEKKILLPEYENFPFVYDGAHLAAYESLKIVATQMDVAINEIVLDFYTEGISEIGTGGMGGGKIFISAEKDSKKSSGKYYGKQEDDKYHIGLEQKTLKDPIGLVATLAHEIAHIKLLGEGRIENNNEPLTDLTTIIFGMGIFNANAAFRYNSGFDQWGYQSSGYLSPMHWGYALAVYASLRNEQSPPWTKYLSGTVGSTFKRSEEYILFNQAKQ